MRRLQRRHYLAILSALDADIVARMEAGYNDIGERIDEDVPEDERIDAEVPAMKEAEAIIKERFGIS